MIEIVRYNLKLDLDLRYKNTEEKYQICLLLYFKGTVRYISLGVHVKKSDWDRANERILPSAKLDPNVSWYNDRITEKKLLIKKILQSLDETDQLKNIAPADLLNRLKKKSKRLSFSQYLENHIKLLLEHGREGNALNFQNLKPFLEKYLPEKKDILFDDFNSRSLKKIEYRYIARGNSYNGLSNYLRTIRTLFNKAMKEWPELKDIYPFGDYKIKQVKTHKTAIGRDELVKIMKLTLKPDNRSWHSRNLFLFSFHCRGMNLTDIAKLKIKDIQNGRILYRRSKNAKPFNIKINDQISEILGFYIIDKKQDDYVFPIISAESKSSVTIQIREFRHVTNHALKRWAKKLNINPSLSFNTARHSWATIGKEMNIPIAAISEGLGHNDIRTTQIYLDSFNEEVIDNANEMIGNSLLSFREA
jgi:integrase